MSHVCVYLLLGQRRIERFKLLGKCLHFALVTTQYSNLASVTEQFAVLCIQALNVNRNYSFFTLF